MNNFKDLFDQITTQLFAMYEVNLEGNTFRGNSTQFSIKESYERAIECAKFDPSYLTSLTIIEHTFNQALSSDSYPLITILNPDEQLKKQLEFGAVINDLLKDIEYQDQKSYFINKVLEGIKHYGSNQSIANSDIFDIRYKAINSFKLLQQNQFIKGSFRERAPQYIKQIYEWWNINSLLDFALTLPNSISLHIIRNPNFYESFFCILIKNGSNIYTLTDGIDAPNPFYMANSRRPDRSMSRRIEKHLFPYYLLNVESTLGDLYELDNDQTSTAIVPFQKNTHIVLTLDELKPDNLIWIILLFDLIYQNFFINQQHLPELSYTNETLRNPEHYLALAEKHGLTVEQDVKAFDEITVESLHTDNIDHTALGYDVQSNWMEERYASQIDSELLNIHAKLEDNHRYEIDSRSLTVTKKDENVFPSHSKELIVKGVIASNFGTEDQLRKDRIFIARYNYAKLIEEMAHREFDNKKAEFTDWFRKLCEANPDLILKRCAETAAMFDYSGNEVKRRNQTIDESGLGTPKFSHQSNTLGVMGLRNEISKHRYVYPTHIMGYAKSSAWGAEKNLCFVTRSLASYEFAFLMRNAAMIQEFFGITADDMPDMLRHYSDQKYYCKTNSRLYRVDPMADIVNPLASLQLAVLVKLSKKGLKQIVALYPVEAAT